MWKLAQLVQIHNHITDFEPSGSNSCLDEGAQVQSWMASVQMFSTRFKSEGGPAQTRIPTSIPLLGSCRDAEKDGVEPQALCSRCNG